MIKQIYLCTIFILISTMLFGTHNKAGEIQVKQLDVLQYEAIIKTYTVTSSTNADRDTLEICWGDGFCELVARNSATLLENNTKFNTYTSQHTYLSSGNYTISMTDRNRSGDINNINGASSDNVAFHIETNLDINSTLNNPPVFLNPPTELGYVGIPLYHNLAAIDMEGDSLVYELVVPLQAVGVPVPLYIFPNDISAGPGNNLSLDQETGLITWGAPQIQGSYVLTIQVVEYRDGNILSTTIRDMEFSVGVLDAFIMTTDNLPEDDLVTENGGTINFNFTISEINSEELKVRAFGLPFLLENPATIDLPSDFIAGPVEGTFSWDILDEHASLSPYNMVFRIDTKVDNNVYTEYRFVKIVVDADPLSLDFTINNLPFEIFPNPAYEEKIVIKSPELNNSLLEIKIYNELGKLIFVNQDYSVRETYPLNIPDVRTGVYFIRITSNKKIGFKKLVIL